MQSKRIVNVLTTARVFRVTLVLALILALVPTWGNGNVSAQCPSGFFFSAGQCWPCTGGPHDGPECAGGTEPEPEPPSKPWWEGSDDNGQYRVNPNPAADFVVYCRPPGWVEVWQTQPPPAQKVAGFPIAWVYLASRQRVDSYPLDLEPFSTPLSTSDQGYLSRFPDLTMRNSVVDADRLVINAWGSIFVRADFSLRECVEKAGLTMTDLGKPPCDPVALAAAEARVAELEAQNEARIDADELSLRQQIAATSDPGLRRRLQRRLDALRDGSFVAGELGTAREILAALGAACADQGQWEMFEERYVKYEGPCVETDFGPDCAVQTTRSYGTVRATYSNGTVVTTMPDGSSVTSRTDGTMSATIGSNANVQVPPGTQFTFDPQKRTGELTVGQGGMDLPGQGLKPWPQGTVVTLGENGELTVKYPDGTVDEGHIIPSVDRVFRQLEEWAVKQQEQAGVGG